MLRDERGSGEPKAPTEGLTVAWPVWRNLPYHEVTRGLFSVMANGAYDFRAIMRWILAAFYVTAGVAHFAVPDKLLSITPDWVPYARQVIFLTGAFEFAASIALITRPLRLWAGIAMAAYAVCVWPANFKQAIDGIDLPYVPNSWLYHAPRLALQPVIVWWALYCAGVINWPWRPKGLSLLDRFPGDQAGKPPSPKD